MNTPRTLIVLAVLVLTAYLLQTGLRRGWIGGLAFAQEPEMTMPYESDETVPVQVFNTEGTLVGPVHSPKIVKTDAQWKSQLTDGQYNILRKSGTERAFTGTLLDNKTEGVYACAACGLPLYTSDTKFKSGTGWPSFYQPIADENVTEISDESLGMARTEVRCARCDGHLGHVFNDGPQPTGMRHCLNSESLQFTSNEELPTLADPFAYQPPHHGRSGDRCIRRRLLLVYRGGIRAGRWRHHRG